MGHETRGASRAWTYVPPGRRSARRPRAGPTVFLVVFLHDRPACPAHGDRRGPHVVPAVARVQGQIHSVILHSGGHRRPILALCRYHLDFPVPVALFDSASSTLICMNTWIRSKATRWFLYRS